MDRHLKALEILGNGTFIPATPLALTDDRKFDEAQQRKLINYFLDAKVGGIATAVHTTQFEIRNPEVNLFDTILKTVIEEVSAYEEKTGKVIVRVAGVCGKTEQAVREAELAKAYGYDAVLLSPGGLKDFDEDYLLERAEAVAKVMPVIGFYLQVAVGGRHFTYDFWEKFCAIDNVVAIKCASFNRYSTFDVVRACALSPRADKIALYTGNDDNIVIDLLTKYSFNVDGRTYEKRFVGGLLGHWSCWTATAVKIYHKLREDAEKGEITPEHLTLAAEVTDANAAFFDTANDFKGCIAGVHEVLRRTGAMKNILCLNPNETLSPGQMEEIDRVYRMYPHLHEFDDR